MSDSDELDLESEAETAEQDEPEASEDAVVEAAPTKPSSSKRTSRKSGKKTKKSGSKNKTSKKAAPNRAASNKAASNKAASKELADENSEASETPQGDRYLCVHCDHRFQHESTPARCPSCLRKGGLELIEPRKSAGQPTWLVPVIVLGGIVAVAAGYAMWNKSTPDVVEGEAPLAPLTIAELRGHLRQSDADGPHGRIFEAKEGTEALAAFATGSSVHDKATSLLEHLRERAEAGGFRTLPLDMPRDTAPFGADRAAEEIADDDDARLYPLEVALAMTVALREADVPAMIAEIWAFPGDRRPPDPSGQIGYFGVAVYDGEVGEGDPTIYDPYVGHGAMPEDDGFRVLTDVQAVAASMNTAALHRIVHENDAVRSLSDVQHALMMDPRSPYIRSVRGTVLMQSGGIDEGKDELESAAQIRPDAPRRNNMGGLLIAMQRFDDASREIAAALESHPDFAFARANFAAVHMAAGEMDEARRELTEAERLQPRLHVLPLLWAQYHLAARDPEQAIHWAEVAVERQPRNLQAHLAAAQIYGAVGQSDAMRREVQEVLALVPRDRQEAYRQEIRARLGASALEEPDDLDILDEGLGLLDGDDDLGDLGAGQLGEPGELQLGGGGLMGDEPGGGPSLLDDELGGGGFELGGGGGPGGLRLGGGGGGASLMLRL